MSLLAILNECARITAGSGSAALASVARRKGSLPMSGSAKMLVAADGSRTGTVGGGCLEAEIIERAQEVLISGRPMLSEHTLNSEIAGDYGLTCGGTAVMFIEPVIASELLHSVYSGASGLMETGERGVIATATSWENGPRKSLFTDGRVIGSSDPGLVELVRNFAPGSEDQVLVEGALVEPVVGAPTLIVFGGGHVGASIAQAASFAGWRVTVVDDRPDYASAARHSHAAQTLVCDFHDIPVGLLSDPSAYVVVATRGHQHDTLIVEQLSDRSFRYVGMLGSRRKVALAWDLLVANGVAAADLEKIHAPVGLAIGADTPQEIAVSVVAEMIAVRRAGTRRRGGALPDYSVEN